MRNNIGCIKIWGEVTYYYPNQLTSSLTHLLHLGKFYSGCLEMDARLVGVSNSCTPADIQETSVLRLTDKQIELVEALARRVLHDMKESGRER